MTEDLDSGPAQSIGVSDFTANLTSHPPDSNFDRISQSVSQSNQNQLYDWLYN